MLIFLICRVVITNKQSLHVRLFSLSFDTLVIVHLIRNIMTMFVDHPFFMMKTKLNLNNLIYIKEKWHNYSVHAQLYSMACSICGITHCSSWWVRQESGDWPRGRVSSAPPKETRDPPDVTKFYGGLSLGVCDVTTLMIQVGEEQGTRFVCVIMLYRIQII